MTTKILPSEAQDALIDILKTRFMKNMNRHQNTEWANVEITLKEQRKTSVLWSLNEMENTGGEPDVIEFDVADSCLVFCDCAPETPIGRRNCCYDSVALASRKQFKPEHNAMDMAEAMGISILNEEQYRTLQQFGPFDTKTSSWIKTPDNIRKLGGALFAEYRYGETFVFHNSAPSYYAVRAFRAMLKV